MKKNFFIKNLKTYMFANEVEVKDLAAKLGITVHAVGRWLNHQRNPPKPTSMVLAGIIGVPLDELMDQDLTFPLIIKAGMVDPSIVMEESAEYGKMVQKSKVQNHLRKIQEQLKIAINDTELAMTDLK